MKKLKKHIEKERQKILEEDTFFDDVLVPMINEKNTRQQRQKKCLKIKALIIAPMLTIVTLIIVAVYIFTPAQSGYMGSTETKTSDITTANQAFKNIQLIGEFDSVILSYNSETLKQHIFTIRKEIVTEELLADCEMDIVVDRSYDYKTSETNYADTFIFLSYIVKYTEEIKPSLFEGIPVNEFNVQAFMDTGHEKLYFTYTEISCTYSSNFTKTISTIIINK